jgi:hypothetical protein
MYMPQDHIAGDIEALGSAANEDKAIKSCKQ